MGLAAADQVQLLQLQVIAQPDHILAGAAERIGAIGVAVSHRIGKAKAGAIQGQGPKPARLQGCLPRAKAPDVREHRFAAQSAPATASTTPTADAGSYADGQVVQDRPTCPQMVVLPARALSMGWLATEEARGRDEGPRHAVTFAAAFAVGRTEVTFDQWNVCVAEGGRQRRPADQGWGRGGRPVIDVTWNDAMAYAAWLSKTTGQAYHLLSESEWEYAARAGTDTRWNTGDAIVTDDANLLGQFGKTVPVGGYPPNAFGLHDLHGNAAEWVQDCHEDTGYFGAPADGAAAGQAGCAKRVERGGSFADEPDRVRSAARKGVAPSQRSPEAEFRVARSL